MRSRPASFPVLLECLTNHPSDINWSSLNNAFGGGSGPPCSHQQPLDFPIDFVTGLPLTVTTMKVTTPTPPYNLYSALQNLDLQRLDLSYSLASILSGFGRIHQSIFWLPSADNGQTWRQPCCVTAQQFPSWSTFLLSRLKQTN